MRTKTGRATATDSLLLTVVETAALLSISLPTAYELVKRQDFPSMRVGRKILVSRAGLDNWIQGQLGELHNCDSS